MKRFTGLLLLSVAVLANSATFAAEDKPDEQPVYNTEVTFGVDVNSAGSFHGYTLYHLAPEKGGMDESGPRFWLLGGGGFYHYTGDTGKVRGSYWDTDALIGYSFESDAASIAFYAGLNAQEHYLSIRDPQNPVQGTSLGAKFRTSVWYNPAPATLLYGEGEYSTSFGTYSTTGKYGYSITPGETLEETQIYVGPQITLLGDERHQEWRIGGHMTSFNLGRVDFELGAGFEHNTDNGSGAYAIVEVTTKF